MSSTTKISTKVNSSSEDGFMIFEKTDGDTAQYSIGYDHSSTNFKLATGTSFNASGTTDVLVLTKAGALTLGSAPKSGTDQAGQATVFTGGSGTGDADGGSIQFKVACAGSAGTTVNAADDTVMTISAGAAAASSNVTIAGNLTVNGTTTTINSTTVTVDDPVFTLGGTTAVVNGAVSNSTAVTLASANSNIIPSLLY